MDIKLDTTKDYLGKIKEKFNFREIEEFLKKISNLKVLAIGDTVLDQYVFAYSKGRAVKDNILSVGYKNDETYAGGVLALANHLATFVKNIKVVTLVGDKESYIDFILKSVPENTEIKYFVKPNSPTTIKKRYVDAYKNVKLFKIEYMNDEPISGELSNEIVEYLEEELPKYDIVIVLDYSHGFIDQAIRSILEKKSKFLSINVQSNSANMGFNYVNLYKKADFVTMNEQELRMPLLNRFDKIEDVMNEFHKKFGFSKFLVTTGKKGSVYYNDGVVQEAPILISSVVDTVGAGDALFAISSLFVYAGADDEIIPFIANSAGGIKVNYIGNKESVTKVRLTNFLKDLKIKWPGYKEKMKQALDTFEFDERILDVLRKSIKNNQKIFIGGNGGSAAIASHYVCDFSKGATKNWLENFNRYKVISLTENVSYITAISNDKHYDDVFKQQLINLAEPHDILIMISSSGNSPNVVSAVQWAKEHGMVTIGISGFEGGKLRELVDFSAHLSWPEYETCEDVHTVFGHFLATYLREFEEATDVITQEEAEVPDFSDEISRVEK
jgi:rfaE bifunctional protein kinase chain/domain